MRFAPSISTARLDPSNLNYNPPGGLPSSSDSNVQQTTIYLIDCRVVARSQLISNLKSGFSILSSSDPIL